MNSKQLLDFNVKRCKRCIMPKVKGHIDLDENGICSLCHEEMELKCDDTSSRMRFNDISAEKKKEIFLKKVKRYSSGGKYDCLVAVSGGKDSIMTMYIAHKIGLKPLALFIDNGFALPEMYDNIRNAVDRLSMDWLTYRTNDMKKLFTYFLTSQKHIYYCRACHILLENIIKETCQNYNIKLILGGYTKGQSYLKQEALSWIFEESDKNTLEVIERYEDLSDFKEMFTDPIKYSLKHYQGIVQISPFKYLEYDEDKIIEEIQKELGFNLPEHSWPAHSTNCSFNYVSQYLAFRQFGYSQHETEFSDLVRSGEMTRQRAEQLINTPITTDDVQQALDVLNLTMDDII